MAYDRLARKSRVEMLVDDDLIRQARILTSNLSETVEQLLAGFVEQAVMREAERQRLIDQHIVASNAFVAAYGSWSDGFSTLRFHETAI